MTAQQAFDKYRKKPELESLMEKLEGDPWLYSWFQECFKAGFRAKSHHDKTVKNDQAQ